MDLIGRIEAKIEETKRWRAWHADPRNTASVPGKPRQDHTIEALCCNVRLNALQECLDIAKGEKQ